MDLNLFDVLGFLRNKSSASPLVVRIEDVHWADSASIQMLHFLARNLSSMRVLFLCTYRPEDLVGSEGEVHPLTDALRNMGREGILKEIHLSRLKEDDVTTIVNGFLASKVEREISRAVACESEGNPLFALEVMELLVSTGQISKDGLIWRMSRPEPVNLPTTIRDVVTGEWTHVAVTRTESSRLVQIFVNGALDATGDHTGDRNVGSCSLIVIGANTLDSRYFRGAIDEALKAMVSSGQVAPATMAWNPGAAGWAPHDPNARPRIP